MRHCAMAMQNEASVQESWQEQFDGYSLVERDRGGASVMEKGYLALVLHAHLPFVRHPESEYVFGGALAV